MKIRIKRWLILQSFCVWCAGNGFAEVRPAGIFTDGAVLQQQSPVRIWGVASPGEKVTVTFSGQTLEITADSAGEWMVTLKGMPACAEGRSLVIKGSQTAQPVDLKDVLVGEVWLAGGQSNMETTMGYYSKTTQNDINRANDPLLRVVTIPRLEFAGQNSDSSQWKTTTPQNVRGFSACAYYFARNLRESRNVPIGIISCSVGATPVAVWMSRQTLERNTDLKRILDAYTSRYCEEFASDEEYIKTFNEFSRIRDEYRREWSKTGKQPPGPTPQPPMGPRCYKRPCGLHETMLTQTLPYTIRGVIWYQGETDANWPAGFDYRTVFPALIGEWRGEFKDSELPFLFVQIATMGPVATSTPYWPELRESQSLAEEHVQNSGMVVIVDGGEVNNIHPHSKDKVGYRLSLLARHMVYGETNLVCRGPKLETIQEKEGSLELTFSDTGSGLVLEPADSSAFEICGKNGKYMPANARLVDGKIIVSAVEIPAPQFVRYGWKQWFIPVLFNKEGLPASPFRTDDFPSVTADRYYLDRK